MSDPRNNADDAYAAFMSMGEDEWQGCLRSILGGGVFQPAEQQGFERALKDRRPLTMAGRRSLPATKAHEKQLPSIDRAWELAELAYDDDGLRVLGWADDMVMLPYNGRLNFDTTDTVQHSHEDEVLIIAVRVPHPDEMTLDEVLREPRAYTGHAPSDANPDSQHSQHRALRPDEDT